MLIPALLSHYRRHPYQLAALALMIVLATMLWTGVTLLTDQARHSLFQSEAAVETRVQVVRSSGQAVTVDDFARLRMTGACVAPWLEVQRPAPQGRVIGIDPLALGCFGEAAPGEQSGALDGAPFVDISKAVILADRGYDSQLTLLAADNQLNLPQGYGLKPFSLAPPTGELADSFLLNLDALSLLVLLITGLLVRSVHRLGIAQRQESFDLLFRFGVSREKLQRLLALELAVLTIICVLPGFWLGLQLAGLLGNGFGQALGSLFDVTLYAGSGESLPWRAAGIMVLLVLGVCVIDWLVPQHWQNRLRKLKAWPVLLAGLVMVVVAGKLSLVFVGTALVFVGVGLVTPGLLAGLAQRRSDRAGVYGDGDGPLSRWRHRELAVMFQHLALPLVALQFAMATVLAVQALVTTFERTFDDWLGQRLAAEFYIQVPPGADSGLAADYLNNAKGVGAWHQVTQGSAQVLPGQDKQPAITVDLMAVTPVTELLQVWKLLDAVDRPWQKLDDGGVMINEQLARRHGLQPGDRLELALADSTFQVPVLGVYADYGRPAGELLVSGDILPENYSARSRSFSVNPGELTMAEIREQLAGHWGRAGVEVRDNVSIRALASQVFSQTFLLTRAISLLTLVLAAVALLVMSWVFFTTRARYFRLLSVWGLPASELLGQLRRLSVSLTLAVTLAALPLGIWLTWVLVGRINPLAFGWSLPMDLYPRFWLELAAVAVVTGLVVAQLMRRAGKGEAKA